MRRALEVTRRDGLIALLDGFGGRARSFLLRRRYGYAPGFLVGYSAQWLGGSRVQVGRNFRAGKRLRVDLVEVHLGHRYEPQLTIGDDVSLNDDVHIGCAGRVSIGNGVLMASKIYISDHNHGVYSGPQQNDPAVPPSERLLSVSSVHIGDRAWIGEMVSVLPGVTIGEGAIIGAGSVVSRDIPANCIAVGAPAKVVKRFDAVLGVWTEEPASPLRLAGEEA